MGDSYVECLVERDRDTRFYVLRIVMYVLCALCILLALGGSLIIFIIGVALGVVGAFVIPQPDIEYEYLYMSKELSIDRIIAKSKRKAAASYDLNKMEVMCPVNSHELDSYKNRNITIKDFGSNKADAKNYAIIIHDDNSECMVIIEPNDELKQAIKTVFPRKVVEY